MSSFFAKRIYFYCVRSLMDVNGESMDKNCQKETHVLKHIIAAA